jgi:hypothetical protein
MKTITVTFVWKSSVRMEVPDGFKVPSTLDGFPEDVLEEVTPLTAELVDWK